MAISWTKYWQGSDDGTILRGVDLRNIQDDIDANSGDANKIRGKNVVAPTSGDDGQALFWDNGNNQYDYKDVVDIAGTETITGTKTFNVLKFNEQASGPTTSTNEVAFYGKDVSGATHPFFRLESSGSEIDVYADMYLASSRKQVFLSSGTFTAPVGVTKVYITMCAGGGGGGGGTNGVNSGGGGGAGESIIRYPYTVVPGNNYTVTVGGGGAGGPTNNPGSNGEDSVFDTITVLKGSAGTSSAPGVGGSGGGSSTVKNASTTTGGNKQGFPGGSGANGGGGSGGGGGGSMLGAGASAGTGAGTAATANTGAGGSGAGTTGNTAGGAGGSGICIVEY